MPKNVMQAIKNTMNETSSDSSISEQDWLDEELAAPSAALLEVADEIPLAQAVTGISALLKKL